MFLDWKDQCPTQGSLQFYIISEIFNRWTAWDYMASCFFLFVCFFVLKGEGVKESIIRLQDFFNTIQPNHNTHWMLKMNGHPWPQISFFFSFWLSCGLWDLSSPTRDWTQAMAVKARVLTTRPSGNSPKFQIFVFFKLFIIRWLFFLYTYFQVVPKYI